MEQFTAAVTIRFWPLPDYAGECLHMYQECLSIERIDEGINFLVCVFLRISVSRLQYLDKAGALAGHVDPTGPGPVSPRRVYQG